MTAELPADKQCQSASQMSEILGTRSSSFSQEGLLLTSLGAEVSSYFQTLLSGRLLWCQLPMFRASLLHSSRHPEHSLVAISCSTFEINTPSDGTSLFSVLGSIGIFYTEYLLLALLWPVLTEGKREEHTALACPCP